MNFNSIGFAPKLTNCFQTWNMLVPKAHGQAAPTQATQYTPRIWQNSQISFLPSQNSSWGARQEKNIKKRKIGCMLTFRLHWFLLLSSGKNHILHFPGKPSPSLSKQAAFLLLFLPKPSSVHRSASTHTQGTKQGRLCSPVSHPGSSALLQNEARVQTST